MSTTELGHCDFCGTLGAPADYLPSGTRLGMEVWICRVCGLGQSRQTQVPDTKVRTLSTDADWGNVRHGKGVRFEPLRQLMDRHVDWRNVDSVLDVGSNRGDFVLWVRDRLPAASICAVEPDETVTERYRALPGVDLRHDRLEKTALVPNSFALVYCCHTLEHATSAAGMLKQIHATLKPGGFLVLEVPNLAAIGLDDIVEEYFIDKHCFHFDRKTLIDYVCQCGYEIVEGLTDTDPLNLTLLLRRSEAPLDYMPCDSAARITRNLAWLMNYGPRLETNRKLLQRIVEEKLRPLAQRQRVAYWGAGRIFDALVKYGGLRSTDVYSLVDRFLYGIVSTTHGVKIDKPERLRLTDPHVIVILGNSAEATMARQAYNMGVRHVVKFSELMEQVRDVPVTSLLQICRIPK